MEEIPRGENREAVKARDIFIRDFYAQWIATHPDKKVWNRELQDYIHVKFISINETREKAARSYKSTVAVTRLTEILKNSKKLSEQSVKRGNKNQSSYEKMIIMRLEDIKLVVGVQKTNRDKVQYCISSITK